MSTELLVFLLAIILVMDSGPVDGKRLTQFECFEIPQAMNLLGIAKQNLFQRGGPKLGNSFQAKSIVRVHCSIERDETDLVVFLSVL